MHRFILGSILMIGWVTVSLAGLAGAQPMGDRYGSTEGVALKAEQPPVVDGDLSEACWQNAPAIEQFTDLDGQNSPVRRTRLKFVFDDSYLYLGAWCEEPNPEKLKAAGKPDENVWQDDCLELFFRHTKETGEFVQFVCNSRDVHEDHMFLNLNSPGPRWNPTWTSKTKILKDAWTTEMRIALKDLGVVQPVLAGDYLDFKVGREIWSDFVAADPKHPERYAVWPARQVYNAAGQDFGRIYLMRKNVLPNPEFIGQANAQGFYPYWYGDGAAATRYRVLREGYEAVVEVAADRASGWMGSEARVRQGDSYRYSVETKGDIDAVFYVRVPDEKGSVAIEQHVRPSADWVRTELSFSTSFPGNVAAYIGVGDRTPGKKVLFRRLEIVKEVSSAQPYYLTWKIKEPLLDQGLTGLRQRRFGIKPYELITANGCQGERLVFKDTSTETPIWLMTRDRGDEGHYYHNMEWIFSFNGKWLATTADRLESPSAKSMFWATRTDGSKIVPLVREGYTCNHHWSPWEPDVYYYDIQADPGVLRQVNLETGERKVVAELGPWYKRQGIVLRPGPWSDRLVVVNPDRRTGFTIKRDGTGRKDVVFEPPGSPEIHEMLFSTGFPNIFCSRSAAFELEADGGIRRLGSLPNRQRWANMTQHPGHSDVSKSEKYLARPSGVVVHPDGREEKVYDPSPHFGLGGNMGLNGYASWGPTDDWFIVEYGQHFVRVRADGRAQDFLGFHFAKSLDYYSLSWGQVSPDGTKIASKTTLLDNPDILLMPVALPQPPAKVRIEGDSLVWEAAPLHAETRGYLVHSARRSGGPYTQVTREPLSECRWRLPTEEGPAFYVLTALEHSGLPSLYSAEAAVKAGDAPRWFYAEAETLRLERPVVERRETSATGWHYVAQDPYLASRLQKAGRLSWTCPVDGVPAGKEFYLWLRARKSKGGAEGQAGIQAGMTTGQARLAKEEWTWIRCVDEGAKAVGFVAQDGRLEVVATLRNHSIEIDALALTTEAAEQPRAEGCVDNSAPQPPQELKVTAAEAEATVLSWQASPDADVSHYNVYASAGTPAVAAQRNLVGSPLQAKFVDWGLKAGTLYNYVVTSVDRYGNESAACAAVTATTPAKTLRTIRLAAAQAKLEMSGEGPVLLEAGVVGLQLFVRAERFVPTAFQLPSHQPMLGIHRRVLPPRLLHFVTRTRATLLPVIVKLLSLTLDVFARGETQLQRRRGDRLQQPLDHERLQHRPREALAHIGAVVDRIPLATVTQRLRRRRCVAVTDEHVMPAPAADH